LIVVFVEEKVYTIVARASALCMNPVCQICNRCG